MEVNILTDVLKERMGFDGLVVGDWNGHGQIEGFTNENCPQAVIAGLDVLVVPTKAWKPLLENTIAQVKDIIPMERIDDAIRRILQSNYDQVCLKKVRKSISAGDVDSFGSESHRRITRQAVRESLVLLKNNDDLLPLSPKSNILVASDGADNIGKQSGGWSISWQSADNKNSDFPGGSSIMMVLWSKLKLLEVISSLIKMESFLESLMLRLWSMERIPMLKDIVIYPI